MVQMAQVAMVCACDLAGLVVKKPKVLEVEAILIRYSRAQCGCAHIVLVVPAVPALPIAVEMVACEEGCAVMGIHRDQAPDCSRLLEERVDYIVAVMRAMAVADAAEGCIHSGLGAGRAVSSVGGKYRRWNLGCCPAVLAVAAD